MSYHLILDSDMDLNGKDNSGTFVEENDIPRVGDVISNESGAYKVTIIVRKMQFHKEASGRNWHHPAQYKTTNIVVRTKKILNIFM